MARRMLAITFIFGALAIAWFILAGSVSHRTWSADSRLKGEVSGLWGSTQTQLSPELSFRWRVKKTVNEQVKDPTTKEIKLVTRENWVWMTRPVILDRSRISVDLQLDHRKKGLLWYSTYGVELDGEFTYSHEDKQAGELVISYRFPTAQASYDGFHFEVGGITDPQLSPVNSDGTKMVEWRVPVAEGAEIPFRIGYRSRGLDSWRYSFGQDVSRVKDFSLVATTDFADLDFSEGSISPSVKERTGDGWRLTWSFENLISGFQIGLEMPHRLNPGPLAAQIVLFAPISLGLFFVWMFVITLMREIELHPLNYLFLGGAFFAFHLLFSYTVDHLPLIAAFLLSSAVSMFLVISYLRLVVGLRFAAVEAGISQLVYLVMFSYAHFLEGFTGLAVTVGSILTLFALMQVTGRIDWSSRLETLDAGRRRRRGPLADAQT